MGHTLLATHTQETFLQSSALEIRLELLLYEIRQRPIGRGAQLAECGIVLLDEPFDRCLPGEQSTVSWSIGIRVRSALTPTYVPLPS
jgi:hypothetical protein